jgi:hypothetical protein
MTFEEILPLLRNNEKVKRASWESICYMYCAEQATDEADGLQILVDGIYIPYVLLSDDLIAKDWCRLRKKTLNNGITIWETVE